MPHSAELAAVEKEIKRHAKAEKQLENEIADREAETKA